MNDGYVMLDNSILSGKVQPTETLPPPPKKPSPIIEPLSTEWEQKLSQHFEKKAVIDDGKVTVGIPTKDRYDILPLTLMSIANQTYKNMHVIIVDDSENGRDIREIPACQAVLQLLNLHNITWQVIWGRKMGQHHSHQMVQDAAKTRFIWRIDDDEIAEPDVLQKLMTHIVSEKVGAVGGLVPQHVPIPPLPPDAKNIISNVNLPNIQWFKHPFTDQSVKEVEHLTSSFLYRRGLANYELSLSPASFREESLFTHEIFRKGYMLLVDPTAITWHFRSPQRFGDKSAWDRDDRFFQEKLRNWGAVTGATSKMIVLDCGKGDHVVVKSLLPELKKKYNDLTLAVCFPDVFEGDDVKLISIADAQQILGNLDAHNIYRFMIDKHWTRPLADAYRELYEL